MTTPKNRLGILVASTPTTDWNTPLQPLISVQEIEEGTNEQRRSQTSTRPTRGLRCLVPWGPLGSASYSRLGMLFNTPSGGRVTALLKDGTRPIAPGGRGTAIYSLGLASYRRHGRFGPMPCGGAGGSF